MSWKGDEVWSVRASHKVYGARHFPAIEDGELLRIVSIGDLVKNIISDRNS